MKLLAIAALVIVVGMQTASAQSPDVETPAMKAHNEQFRAREAARPLSETTFGYKETDEYKNASPEKKQKIDEGQRKAKEQNAKIQGWLQQATRFQDCEDAHKDDPYRATNCDKNGNYVPNRLNVR